MLFSGNFFKQNALKNALKISGFEKEYIGSRSVINFRATCLFKEKEEKKEICFKQVV